MTISILHLTDIHAGPGELLDADNKVVIPGAERAKQLPRLKSYLAALPNRPDFVIVSGDVTIQGQKEGLEDFRQWLLELIKLGILPTTDRIIITPGNHDVVRQMRVAELEKPKFHAFSEILGKAFPHAHLPKSDPPLDPNKPAIPKKPQKVIGGIKPVPKAGRVELRSSFPFLLDLQRDVLIFAFNSAHGCGVPLEPNKRILSALTALAELHSKDDQGLKITETIEAYLDSLVIDAGLITDSQIMYFSSLMARLRRDLGEQYNRLTKIAFLHHHVSHLWRQQLELKSFEAVVDASHLKQALTENAFDFVLHGHKHTNHVGLDGALIPISEQGLFSPLCIISGGTVGGHPRLNDQQTFKLLTLHGERGPRTKATILEVPIQDTTNYAEAIKSNAKIYHAPISQRLPQLHDLSAIKEILDKQLQVHCAPELEACSTVAANATKIQPATKGILAASLRYQCHSYLENDSHAIFYEFFLATQKIDFGRLARIYWLVSDVTALSSRKGEKHQVVVAIGNLEDTHFFQGVRRGEVTDSIVKVQRDFSPAIEAGMLDLRTYKFSQDELDEIVRTL